MHNDEILIIGILNIRDYCGLSLLTFPTDCARRVSSEIIVHVKAAPNVCECSARLVPG